MPYAPGSPHRRDRAGVIRVQRGSRFCSWRLRAWRAFFPALCRNVAGGISCGEPGAMAAAGAGGRLGRVVGLANGMDEQAAGRSTSEASGDNGGVERGLLTGSSTNPLGGGQTSAPSPLADTICCASLFSHGGRVQKLIEADINRQRPQGPRLGRWGEAAHAVRRLPGLIR